MSDLRLKVFAAFDLHRLRLFACIFSEMASDRLGIVALKLIICRPLPIRRGDLIHILEKAKLQCHIRLIDDQDPCRIATKRLIVQKQIADAPRRTDDDMRLFLQLFVHAALFDAAS